MAEIKDIPDRPLEVHIYNHYYPQPMRYQGVWHGILPPPITEPSWYYQPTYTTTRIRGTQRYDSI